MFQVVFLALIALSYSALAQNPCGDDPEWRYSPHSNKCYRLYREKIGWTAGEFKCYFQGAHQPAIHNAIENQFIAELARQAGTVWVGAAQFGNNPDYVNADHTPFDFENWQVGSRPPMNRGKKCIKLDGNTGMWYQSCCKVPDYLICAKNAGYSPVTSAPANTDTNGINRFKFARRV